MIIDYYISMIRSIKNQSLSSRFGWAGILRKFSVILVVLMAHAIDHLLITTNDPLFDISLRTLVIWAYLINEAVSILENLRDAGVYVPNIMKKAMNLLKDRYDPTDSLKTEKRKGQQDGNNPSQEKNQ